MKYDKGFSIFGTDKKIGRKCLPRYIKVECFLPLSHKNSTYEIDIVFNLRYDVVVNELYSYRKYLYRG
jgi:hypothetical protein